MIISPWEIWGKKIHLYTIILTWHLMVFRSARSSSDVSAVSTTVCPSDRGFNPQYLEILMLDHKLSYLSAYFQGKLSLYGSFWGGSRSRSTIWRYRGCMLYNVASYIRRSVSQTVSAYWRYLWSSLKTGIYHHHFQYRNHHCCHHVLDYAFLLKTIRTVL